jgi:IS30 family transposase
MAGPMYSAEIKQEFFDLLDRGGTIRAAATAVGVHEAAAYSWVRAAGLTMGRPTARVYTVEEKAEFFRLSGCSGARVQSGHLLQLGAQDRGLHQRGPQGEPAPGAVPAAPSRRSFPGRSSPRGSSRCPVGSGLRQGHHDHPSRPDLPRWPSRAIPGAETA